MNARRRNDGESGQGLVEMAMVLMLLVVIALGLVDFGHVFHTYVVVTNAANVGATYASLSATAANNLAKIQEAALSETDAWAQLCAGTPTVSKAATLDAANKPAIKVTVSCNVRYVIPIPGSVSEVTVTATAIRRVRT